MSKFNFAFVLYIFLAPVFSQNLSDLRLKDNESKLIIQQALVTEKFGSEAFHLKIQNFKFKNNTVDFPSIELLKPRQKKSVALGVILSAILPGAGQFYGESYVKAGIFLLAELVAWGTYIYFTHRGDRKDEEFRKFADENWDVRRYARWLNDQFQQSINWQEPDLQELRRQIILAEQDLRFSHTLPEYYTQQYYEVIGKYQTFMGGWADAENGFGNWLVTGGPGGNYYTYRTPMFLYYAGERQKANDFYDLAKIGPITAILNHILSAADAAWTVSKYNRGLKLQTGFRFQNQISPYTYQIEQIPTFNVRLNF